MAPKAEPEFLFQGRPKLSSLDNGPVGKSRVFQNVMDALGLEWLTYILADKDGTRTTARSKGKAERPFRQGSARNALPLPQARNGVAGQPMAAQLPEQE